MAAYLSVVIPAYNEARRLPAAMRALAEFSRSFAETMEVLIVVEAGSDGTLALARDHAGRQGDSAPVFDVIDCPVHRGKGYAVRTGMLRATGDFVFYMDADLSVPLGEINAFLSCFRERPEVDLLCGNRQHPAARITQPQSWLRRSMGQTFNLLLRAGQLVPAGLSDTQCGFKAFRKRVVSPIFRRQSLDGFAFDVEVLLLARRLGCCIRDLPVEWRNSPETKVHILRDSLCMFRDALGVRGAVDRALRLEPAPSFHSRS